MTSELDAAARKALRKLIVNLMAARIPRATVYDMLDVARQQCRDEDREWHEEIIMDTMDLFHGHCHPSLKV